jgi:hypothetical protein
MRLALPVSQGVSTYPSRLVISSATAPTSAACAQEGVASTSLEAADVAADRELAIVSPLSS